MNRRGFLGRLLAGAGALALGKLEFLAPAQAASPVIVGRTTYTVPIITEISYDAETDTLTMVKRTLTFDNRTGRMLCSNQVTERLRGMLGRIPGLRSPGWPIFVNIPLTEPTASE